MSNSPLVVYTKLSPNHSGKRTKKIDTITIHCMAGNCSVETCGNLFASSSRQASSNYGIGTDGRIALYVDEANRSWCTSSNANDQRAVTIEVANNGGAPDWPVSAKAYAALLDLVTDICKRNGIKRLGVKDAGSSTGGQTSGNTETGLKVGDVVDFKGTQHYTSAAAKDAKTCKPGKATITAVAAGKAHPYHLKAISGGGSTVYGWVNAADISTGSTGTATSYRVRTTADVLNIRKGPGTNYGVAGQIKGKGIYTIVAEAAGPGATKWGKLKSGAGWISLDYVTKL